MSGVLLVTGGAGFIGRAVLATAIDRGWTIRVLDSLRPDVHGHDAVVPAGVECITGDVTDAAAVRRALRGASAVVHLAAKVGLGTRFGEAPDYVASNALGTAVLLAEMAEAGVARLVLASSMVVYGEGRYRSSRGVVPAPPRRLDDLAAGRFDPFDAVTREALVPDLVPEDAPLEPRNVYAATKVHQEHLAAAWGRMTGGTAALLRFHNVYGPGMPQNTPYAGVAALFRSSLERGEAPRVFEDGRQRRDFVHVRDIATAVVAAAQWTGDQGAGTVLPLNVGSGEVHTVGEFAAALSTAMDGPAPIVTGEYRLGDVRHITASSERLRGTLEVPPPVPFDVGVAEFAAARLRPAKAR